MTAINCIKRALMSQPDKGFLGMISSQRHNHTHTDFAFSRQRKPIFRSIPHPKERKDVGPKVKLPKDFMKIYPDFLPDPEINFRNKLREKIERRDMIARRKLVDIPEFYVGSIMSVTISDSNSTDQKNRFVGVCIDRGGTGLRAWFTLRNVIDHAGIEILYEQYCPLILKIEVLRLEKRLDDRLIYLRDCDPIHSTVPLDMQPELIAEGSEVPLNETVITLLPEPWHHKYEILDFKGVQLPPDFDKEKLKASHKKKPAACEKYDLMREYRATIPEEEQEEIFRDISPHYPALKAAQRKFRRRNN